MLYFILTANALHYFLLFYFEFKWLHLQFIRHERPEWMTKSKKCSMFKTSNNFLVLHKKYRFLCIVGCYNFFRKYSLLILVLQKMFEMTKSIFAHGSSIHKGTKAQRSVHSTYNIDFVISNKYWTWLSNCLYHQLSYKVITACNNSCFLSHVIIHWSSKKKTSIIQDEQAAHRSYRWF